MGALYTRRKLMGDDMDWYDRNRKIKQAVLEDEECSNGSIYLFDGDGTLWTLRIKWFNGTPVAEPYKKVRDTGRVMKEPVYVCMHTKVVYDDDLVAALKHVDCEVAPENNQHPRKEGT